MMSIFNWNTKNASHTTLLPLIIYSTIICNPLTKMKKNSWYWILPRPKQAVNWLRRNQSRYCKEDMNLRDLIMSLLNSMNTIKTPTISHTSAKLWRRARSFPSSLPTKINFCFIDSEAEFLCSCCKASSYQNLKSNDKKITKI